jgi:hypothetical protein
VVSVVSVSQKKKTLSKNMVNICPRQIWADETKTKNNTRKTRVRIHRATGLWHKSHNRQNCGEYLSKLFDIRHNL